MQFSAAMYHYIFMVDAAALAAAAIVDQVTGALWFSAYRHRGGHAIGGGHEEEVAPPADLQPGVGTSGLTDFAGFRLAPSAGLLRARAAIAALETVLDPTGASRGVGSGFVEAQASSRAADGGADGASTAAAKAGGGAVAAADREDGGCAGNGVANSSEDPAGQNIGLEARKSLADERHGIGDAVGGGSRAVSVSAVGAGVSVGTIAADARAGTSSGGRSGGFDSAGVADGITAAVALANRSLTLVRPGDASATVVQSGSATVVQTGATSSSLGSQLLLSLVLTTGLVILALAAIACFCSRAPSSLLSWRPSWGSPSRQRLADVESLEPEIVESRREDIVDRLVIMLEQSVHSCFSEGGVVPANERDWAPGYIAVVEGNENVASSTKLGRWRHGALSCWESAEAHAGGSPAVFVWPLTSIVSIEALDDYPDMVVLSSSARLQSGRRGLFRFECAQDAHLWTASLRALVEQLNRTDDGPPQAGAAPLSTEARLC